MMEREALAIANAHLLKEIEMNDRNATNDGLIPIQPEDLEKVAGGFTDEWPCGNDILFWKKPWPQPQPWVTSDLTLDPAASVSLNPQPLPPRAAVSNGFAL
jgi:hypothetical protein